MKRQLLPILLATAMLITSCSCSTGWSHYSESSLDPVSSSEESSSEVPSSSAVSSSESSSSEESSFSSSSSEELPDVDFNYYVDQELVHTDTYTRAEFEVLTGDLWEYTEKPHLRGWYCHQWYFYDSNIVNSLQDAKTHFDHGYNCVNLYGALYADDYATLEYIDTMYSWSVVEYPNDCPLSDIVIPNTFNTPYFSFIGKRFGQSKPVFPSATLSLTLPNTFQGFCDGAFKGLTNLAYITLTDHSSVQPRIFLEDDILYYHGSEWNEDKVLTAIKSTEKNRSVAEDNDIIGPYAFEGSDMETIDLGYTQYINIGAFNGCSQLKSITFSDSMQTIAADSFTGCSNLETIYFHGDEKGFSRITIEDETLAKANVIYC